MNKEGIPVFLTTIFDFCNDTDCITYFAKQQRNWYLVLVSHIIIIIIIILQNHSILEKYTIFTTKSHFT